MTRARTVAPGRNPPCGSGRAKVDRGRLPLEPYVNVSYVRRSIRAPCPPKRAADRAVAFAPDQGCRAIAGEPTGQSIRRMRQLQQHANNERDQTMSEALSVNNDIVDVVAAKDKTTRKTQFTIGDLAKEFGVTLRTLRFYEDKGLLNPKRDGLNRLYNRRDRARLKLVLMGKRVGFSLAAIRDMLDLYDLRDGQVTQLRVALTRFQQQIDVLKQQRKDIDQAIEELGRTVEIVSGMLKEKETESA